MNYERRWMLAEYVCRYCCLAHFTDRTLSLSLPRNYKFITKQRRPKLGPIVEVACMLTRQTDTRRWAQRSILIKGLESMNSPIVPINSHSHYPDNTVINLQPASQTEEKVRPQAIQLPGAKSHSLMHLIDSPRRDPPFGPSSTPSYVYLRLLKQPLFSNWIRPGANETKRLSPAEPIGFN